MLSLKMAPAMGKMNENDASPGWRCTRYHQVPTLLDQQTEKPPGERTEVGRAGPSASQNGRFVVAPEGAH